MCVERWVYVKRKYILAILIIALAPISGCVEPPSNPLRDVPQLIVDYLNNTLKLYVVPLSGYLVYDNISLRINDTWYNESYFYVFSLTINLTYFEMNLSVAKDNRYFNYNATMELKIEEGKSPYLSVMKEDYIYPKTYDFPYKTALGKRR